MGRYPRYTSLRKDTLRPRQRALAQALGAALGWATLGTVQALAATITVNTTADEVTANAMCSLREAIANANSNTMGAADCSAGNGADTILFDPAVFPPNALTASTVTAGALLLSDTTLTTIDGGGVVAIDGGGTSELFKVGTLALAQFQALTIRNGQTAPGGAIANIGGATTVRYCTLSGNRGIHGGALYSGVDLPGVSLTVVNTTITGNYTNSATGRGGGVYLRNGTLSLINSTITGNTAGLGGALFVRGGSADIESATLVGDASIGAVIYAKALSLGSSVALRNTIITGLSNQVDNCDFSLVTLTDLGGNIDGGSSCGFSVAASSFPTTNPLLGVLADNGGPTATMMPLPGSPAIDAIACTALTTDQRGISRPQAAQCDIGAVESDRVFGNGFETATPPCSVNADCPVGADPECTAGVCSASACSVVPQSFGTVCTGGTCDGLGSCVHF